MNRIVANEDAVNSHPFMGASGMNQTAYYYNRVPDALFDVPEIREMYLRRLRTLMDQCLQPPGTPPADLRYEQRFAQMRDYLAEEAARDRAKWGWPVDGMYQLGQISPSNAVNQILTNYLPTRRTHFYVYACITNTAKALTYPGYAYNAGIPLSQPPNAVIMIAAADSNPASGNQQQEYVCLTNRTPVRHGPLRLALDGAVELHLPARHRHALQQRALCLARRRRLPRPHHRPARRAGPVRRRAITRANFRPGARRCACSRTTRADGARPRLPGQPRARPSSTCASPRSCTIPPPEAGNTNAPRSSSSSSSRTSRHAPHARPRRGAPHQRRRVQLHRQRRHQPGARARRCCGQEPRRLRRALWRRPATSPGSIAG